MFAKIKKVSECDNMKILKSMEKETINIKQMSIIKAFFVMVISFLLEVLGLIPIAIFNILSGQSTKVAAYINFGAGVIVKYFVIILLLKWYSEVPMEVPRKQSLNKKNFIYAALIIIGFRLAFDNSLLYWVNKIPMPDFITQAFDEMAISPVILILSVAVIAPISEEIIFRGIILKGMANKMNPTLALVMSSLFFSIIHMNIPQGINAFLIGLIIGFIYLNTSSIYLCIFAHFVNNTVGITISGMFQSLNGKYAILARGISFIIGGIILTVAYKWIKQGHTRNMLEINKQYIEL